MEMKGRPVKRLKRRITADLLDFLTFPSEEEHLSAGRWTGEPFRWAIRRFLSRHGREIPSPVQHHPMWQIAFRIGENDGLEPSPETVAILHVVQEDVPRSRSVYCDQCRVVGWSGHPVCAKRYHFIIRRESSSLDGCRKLCVRCGTSLGSLDLRCKCCNNELTEEDLEGFMYQHLTDPTHILHGIIHSNGFGHLLRVNGREGGSKFLSGCDIMGFWDRLCKVLRVRKVSVMDVSKKYGLEYRLLHAITSGHPWYGNWGYKFCTGSFALTADAYRSAVKTFTDMPLAAFFTHGRTSRTHLQDLISFYWSISEQQLLTVRDLLCFILELLHAIHRQSVAMVSAARKKPRVALRPGAEEDIKRVELAMLKVLQATGGSRWVTWRTLKGAVSRTAPVELIDHCLKELGQKPIEGVTLNVRRNPETDVVEYRLGNGSPASACSSFAPAPAPAPAPATATATASATPTQSCLSEEHILNDLKFLYEVILQPHTMLNNKVHPFRDDALSSATKLLDCKHFVKDYQADMGLDPDPFEIRVLCHAELMDQAKNYTVPPPELIFLATNSTVADLKAEVTRAFQETYLLFRRFQAEDLLDFGYLDDSTSLKFLIGTVGSVRVGGRCMGSYGLHRYRMERGTESWIVSCSCGAIDDDGERMLACDDCGVWLHTRCVGISDLDEVPATFICGGCGGNGFLETPGSANGSRRCKDDMDAAVADPVIKGIIEGLAVTEPFCCLG